MKIPVYIKREIGLKQDNSREGESIIFEGFLTDELSQCIYGIPILIDKEGNTYEALDIRNMGILEPLNIAECEETDEYNTFCGKAAGVYPIAGLSS